MTDEHWHVICRENLLEHPDPLLRAVDDLIRRFDPGGYTLSCPVTGCTWRLDVPRMELDPEPLTPDDYVIRAEGVPRVELEAALTGHVEWHAVSCETVTA